MFNRGREAQMSRFEAFASVAATLRPHVLVRELHDALAAVRALEVSKVTKL